MFVNYIAKNYLERSKIVTIMQVMSYAAFAEANRTNAAQGNVH